MLLRTGQTAARSVRETAMQLLDENGGLAGLLGATPAVAAAPGHRSGQGGRRSSPPWRSPAGWPAQTVDGSASC